MSNVTGTDQSRVPAYGAQSRFIKNKGAFWGGIVMSISFLAVLALIFSPIFRGENALEAADRLFNSIAKGSTYYIAGLMNKAETFVGETFTARLRFDSTTRAEQAKQILGATGATVVMDGVELGVNGDLGELVLAALADCDSMFTNNERALAKRYGMPAGQAIFVWWSVLTEAERAFTRQKQFKHAAFLSTVIKKGVEVSYNFRGITPQSAATRAFWLSFALIFYVGYTLWWGMAIMFLFDGVGLEMKKGIKKEV